MLSYVVRTAVFLLLVVEIFVAPCWPVANGSTPAEHFDRVVAPVLAGHCLECHAGSERKGGLVLADREAAIRGGESGPALVPGKPDESLLWQLVEAGEMPKDRPPLADDEKQILKQWILDGANWGARQLEPYSATTDRRAGSDWWSLQPVANPAPPETKNATWPKNEIDRFILAKLEANGLTPSPPADARTIIRRLYFDLIGLPPTPEEVEEWTTRLSDGSADTAALDDAAYRELVDHLLASPHYGERWARHWLDVVRYGESQGYERNLIRENAWRYRDWVIDALNRDLPYDEFVRRQIAGDVLYPGDFDALVATGYHVIGTWDQVAHLEGSAEMRKAAAEDAREDLVAALGQAFLGLTINCARCHDHKFDPISQKEYYQIAALLGGVTQEEKERQNVSVSPHPEKLRLLQAEIEAKRRQLAELQSTLGKKYGTPGDATPVEGLQALYVVENAAATALNDQSGVGEPLDLVSGGKPRLVSSGPAKKLIDAVKRSGELTIEAWITPARKEQTGPARIVTLSLDTGQRNFTLGQDGDRFDVRLRTAKTSDNGQPSLTSPRVVKTQRMHVVYTFDRQGMARLFVDGKQVAEASIGGDLSNWNDGYQLALGDELSGERRWEGEYHFVALYHRSLTGEEIAAHFRTESRHVAASQRLAELLAKTSDEEKSRYAALLVELKSLEDQEPALRFDGALHVIIPKQPPSFHVLERGDHRKPKEVVSPAGLKALAGLPWDFGLAPDAPEGERRVKLAAWLTDPRNPLTPRVLVNRLWHYHFGQGIVDTPSDFGFNGGKPSHPELLDWLAWRFVQGGWSLKEMHRLMVLSNTYRQSSNANPMETDTSYKTHTSHGTAIDPDNRLLWRANPRRLEGEAARDAALAVSGALNRRLGGPSYRDMKIERGVMGTNHEFTDPTGEFNEEVNRRTIYRLWARSGNNPMLESLDCPDPTVMAPRRMQTITPLQALGLLNSRFMEQCSARFAERLRKEAGEDANKQIERAYALAFARSPKLREAELAREFVARRGLEQFCLVLLNTNEFLFVE